MRGGVGERGRGEGLAGLAGGGLGRESRARRKKREEEKSQGGGRESASGGVVEINLDLRGSHPPAITSAANASRARERPCHARRPPVIRLAHACLNLKTYAAARSSPSRPRRRPRPVCARPAPCPRLRRSLFARPMAGVAPTTSVLARPSLSSRPARNHLPFLTLANTVLLVFVPTDPSGSISASSSLRPPPPPPPLPPGPPPTPRLSLVFSARHYLALPPRVVFARCTRPLYSPRLRAPAARPRPCTPRPHVRQVTLESALIDPKTLIRVINDRAATARDRPPLRPRPLQTCFLSSASPPRSPSHHPRCPRTAPRPLTRLLPLPYIRLTEPDSPPLRLPAILLSLPAPPSPLG